MTLATSIAVGVDNPRPMVSAMRATSTTTLMPPMTATKKRDGFGRITLTDQELVHELEQFGALADELGRRIDGFVNRTSVRATVLSSVVSAHRSAKACVNHLRAASLLADSDV